MAATNPKSVPLGRYLAAVRDKSGMTQADLASKVTMSTATLSRIESGEKTPNDDETYAILQAIGTPQAEGLGEYLRQEWGQLKRPRFQHPNRFALREANESLRKLAELRDDPELKGIFVRQIDLYEVELRRLAEFLFSCEHQIACIGSIGVGKSTAICKMTDLLVDGENKLDRQIVLETGAGGITLCEVHIAQGPNYGLRIVPRSEDSIRRDVEDLSDYLIRMTQPDSPGSNSSNDDSSLARPGTQVSDSLADHRVAAPVALLP